MASDWKNPQPLAMASNIRDFLSVGYWNKRTRKDTFSSVTGGIFFESTHYAWNVCGVNWKSRGNNKFVSSSDDDMFLGKFCNRLSTVLALTPLVGRVTMLCHWRVGLATTSWLTRRISSIPLHYDRSGGLISGYLQCLWAVIFASTAARLNALDDTKHCVAMVIQHAWNLYRRSHGAG